MNWLLLGAAYAAVSVGNFLYQKEAALSRARSLYTGKGILNVGAGCTRSDLAGAVCNLPEVVLNLDNDSAGPKMFNADLETGRLPFADGEFDVAMCSHVLEHLENWEPALAELARVADTVVVVLPNPLMPEWNFLNPDHKQYFSYGSLAAIKAAYPNVEIFT